MIQSVIPMIKTVIFDLGGVLLDLDMPACFDRIRNLGVDIQALAECGSGKDAPKSVICEGIAVSGVMNDYQVGNISTADFMSVIQNYAKKGTSYDDVLDAWNSCLITIPSYKLDYLKELRMRGYKVCLLSNTNDAHWKYIVEKWFTEPLSNYFDNVFLSQEMHLAKPDVRIFQEVLKCVDTPADECLFIDDSKANCKSAETLGIRTYNAPVLTDYRTEIEKYLWYSRRF